MFFFQNSKENLSPFATQQTGRSEELISRAIELGLHDERHVFSLIRMIQQTGKVHPGVFALLEKMVREREQQLIEIPFVYPAISELSGDIPFGKLYRRNDGVFLKVPELFTHTLISGASGFGKTTAIVNLATSICRQLIENLTVIVFDTEKGDLASIAESEDKAALLTDFPDDIFVPPPGEVETDLGWHRYVNDYLNRLMEHIAMLLWSNVGELALEMQAIESLWNRGFFSAGNYPSAKDFIEEIGMIHSKTRTRREDRKLNIEDKWSMLFGAFKYYAERSCLDIERLLDHRLIVIDLSTYDDIKQQVLMVNIIEKLYFYQLKGRGRKRDKRVLLVLDEALPLIRDEANTISGIPPLVSMMAKVRSSNIGFCLCVQNPSLIHPVAAGNASIHVMFRLEGRELEWASRLFQFTPEQEEFVHTRLKPGVALMSMGTRNIRPFPIAFPRQEWG